MKQLELYISYHLHTNIIIIIVTLSSKHQWGVVMVGTEEYELLLTYAQNVERGTVDIHRSDPKVVHQTAQD